jgi:hypothetical protein
MSNVVTIAATIQCPHGFAIADPPGEPLLTIDSANVITADSMKTAVLACTNQAKCTKINSEADATLLFVNNSPVVLDGSMSTNIGTCTVTVSSKLATSD